MSRILGYKESSTKDELHSKAKTYLYSVDSEFQSLNNLVKINTDQSSISNINKYNSKAKVEYKIYP